MIKILMFIANESCDMFEFLKKEKYIWQTNEFFPDIEKHIKHTIKNSILSSSKLVVILDGKNIINYDFDTPKYIHTIYWRDFQKEIRRNKLRNII